MWQVLGTPFHELPPDGWGINLTRECGCFGAGTGPIWMCWGHSGACETLARIQGFASHLSGAACGQECTQGSGGQLQALAAGGRPAVSEWASGLGGSSSSRFEPQWEHVRHLIFNLTLSPHSMSLLITEVQGAGPTLTAGGSGGHGEQEGALCLTLSWRVHGSKGCMRLWGPGF